MLLILALIFPLILAEATIDKEEEEEETEEWGGVDEGGRGGVRKGAEKKICKFVFKVEVFLLEIYRGKAREPGI